MRRGKRHALAVWREVACRKALRPTSAAAEREPHRVDNAGRHVNSIATSEKSIEQVRRAGSCQHCGAELHRKRVGRPPKFCDAACRKAAFRSKQWENSTGRYRIAEAGRNAANQPLVSDGYKANFVGRTSSIVGPAKVIEREIIAGRIWESVVSPDGVACQVARYRTRQWGVR